MQKEEQINTEESTELSFNIWQIVGVILIMMSTIWGCNWVLDELISRESNTLIEIAVIVGLVVALYWLFRLCKAILKL